MNYISLSQLKKNTHSRTQDNYRTIPHYFEIEFE